MDKKSIKIYSILVIIVIVIILIISYTKGNGNSDEKTIQCIADNSLFIVKEGCSACASQKKILEGYLDKFEMVDCAYETEKCVELGIERVPTWIIDNEEYVGVKSIDELKELTGC